MQRGVGCLMDTSQCTENPKKKGKSAQSENAGLGKRSVKEKNPTLAQSRNGFIYEFGCTFAVRCGRGGERLTPSHRCYAPSGLHDAQAARSPSGSCTGARRCPFKGEDSRSSGHNARTRSNRVSTTRRWQVAHFLSTTVRSVERTLLLVQSKRCRTSSGRAPGLRTSFTNDDRVRTCSWRSSSALCCERRSKHSRTPG